jgi:hypothetical protein
MITVDDKLHCKSENFGFFRAMIGLLLPDIFVRVVFESLFFF